MTSRHTRPGRNFGIDILRGISILAVLLLHLNLRIDFKQTWLGASLPRPWFNLFFWSGFHGVALFFVISGFLITLSSLKKWESLPEMNAREFYLYRFARIMPLLAALLLVLGILHGLQVPNFTLNPDKVSLGRAVFAALTFHFNWLEIQVGYLPGNWDILWSLSIEESFYLLFPLACLLVRKEWQFVALILVFFVISPWARTAMYPDNELGDRNHLAYIDAIGAGCISALVARRVHIPDRLMTVLMALGWGLLILVFFFRRTVFEWGLTKNGLYISLLAIGGSLVLLGMHKRRISGKQRRIKALNWLARMGQYSYEIYLTHMFVVLLVTFLFERLQMGGWQIYLVYLTAIVVSYALGALIADKFTDPVNDWLRKRWINPGEKVKPPAGEQTSSQADY